MTQKISPCPVPGCGEIVRVDEVDFSLYCLDCGYCVPSLAVHEQICRAMNPDRHELAVKVMKSIFDRGIVCIKPNMSPPVDSNELTAIIERAMEG